MKTARLYTGKPTVIALRDSLVTSGTVSLAVAIGGVRRE